MPYHIGDTVRVKPGTPCPDVPELDIGGWQGRVIDLAWADRPADPTIGFTFDSVSLRALPVWYLADCEEKGLDWATMYLGLDQVEPAEPRDTEQEAEQVQREIQARVGWLGIGLEGEAIQAVVNSASSTREWDVMQAWDEHLQRHLRFPFAAVVYEFQERGPLRAGDRLTVLGIEDVDDLYGVIVACRQGRQCLYVPLADLAAADEASSASIGCGSPIADRSQHLLAQMIVWQYTSVPFRAGTRAHPSHVAAARRSASTSPDPPAWLPWSRLPCGLQWHLVYYKLVMRSCL